MKAVIGAAESRGGPNETQLRTPDKFVDVSTVTINSATTLWTPASGAKIRFLGGMISVSAAGSVLFTEGTSGATIFRTPILAANVPYNFDLGGLGQLLSTADHTLQAALSVNGSIVGTLYGEEIKGGA